MTERTRLYLDTEFTGLHQQAGLISLALVSDDGRSFYAEFTDYPADQLDSWLRENVLAHCYLASVKPGSWREEAGTDWRCLGDRTAVAESLRRWLAQFGPVTIWADCPAWDWVLFCELFGGAFGVPDNVLYLSHDLATLFSLKGLDPDTNRLEFSGLNATAHNALDDARTVQACYHKLMAICSE